MSGPLRRAWWWLRAWMPLPGVWLVHRAEDPLTLDPDWLGTRAPRGGVRVTSRVVRQPSRHERGGPFHKIALELKAPAWLVRSPDGVTSYLWVDVELPDEDLWALMDILWFAGAVDDGYDDWCRARGHTSTPMPWSRGAERYPVLPEGPEATGFMPRVGELDEG